MCVCVSTDSVIYEVEDPQEVYDDVDAGPARAQPAATPGDTGKTCVEEASFPQLKTIPWCCQGPPESYGIGH